MQLNKIWSTLSTLSSSVLNLKPHYRSVILSLSHTHTHGSQPSVSLMLFIRGVLEKNIPFKNTMATAETSVMWLSSEKIHSGLCPHVTRARTTVGRKWLAYTLDLCAAAQQSWLCMSPTVSPLASASLSDSSPHCRSWWGTHSDYKCMCPHKHTHINNTINIKQQTNAKLILWYKKA